MTSGWHTADHRESRIYSVTYLDSKTGQVFNGIRGPHEPTKAWANSAQPLAFSADRTTFAAEFALDKFSTLRVYDMATLALKTTLETHTTQNYVAVSPDGGRVAVGGNSHYKIVLCDVDRTMCSPFVQASSEDIYGLAFNYDGTKLISGINFVSLGNRQVDQSRVPPESRRLWERPEFQDEDNNKIKVWDTKTGRLLTQINQQILTGSGLVVNPKKNVLAISNNQQLDLVNIENGNVESLITNDYLINSAAFSPDGTELAIGRNTKVFLYKLNLSRGL